MFAQINEIMFWIDCVTFIDSIK